MFGLPQFVFVHQLPELAFEGDFVSFERVDVIVERIFVDRVVFGLLVAAECVAAEHVVVEHVVVEHVEHPAGKLVAVKHAVFELPVAVVAAEAVSVEPPVIVGQMLAEGILAVERTLAVDQILAAA